MLSQKIRQHICTWGGFFERKMMDCDISFLNPGSPKIPKRFDNFNISFYLKSPGSKNIGLISSIEVIIDTFLSTRGSLNWNASTFAQSTVFSSWARNGEKCNCYCYFVAIQTHIFWKSSAIQRSLGKYNKFLS